jgi:DNA-binding MarR family transcriptional regulator
VATSNAPQAPQPPQPPQPGDETLGLGRALRRALTGYLQLVGAELTEAGFPDRRLHEGRVLLMCRGPGQLTISEVGRRLGVTRQAAGKIVAGLRDRGYLDVTPSPTDGREKILALTPRAEEFLTTLNDADHVIEKRLRAELGDDGLKQLFRAFDLLADLPSRQGHL